MSDLVKADAFSHDGNTLYGHYTYQGDKVELTINIDLQGMECEFITNIEGGEPFDVKWGLMREPTNLGIGEQWFFYNPYKGQKFRKLYFCTVHKCGHYGCAFLPRHVLRDNRYSLQMESKRMRIYSQNHNYQSKCRKWGKMYYRGKLTPYGKQMRKAEEYEWRADMNLFTFIAKKLH